MTPFKRSQSTVRGNQNCARVREKASEPSEIDMYALAADATLRETAVKKDLDSRSGGQGTVGRPVTAGVCTHM